METKLIMNKEWFSNSLSHAILNLWLPFCFSPLTSALIIRSWYFTATPSNSSPLLKSQHSSHPFLFLCVTRQRCFASTTESYSVQTRNKVSKLFLEDVNSFTYTRAFFIHFKCAQQKKSFFFLMSKGNDFCFLFSRQLPNISEQNNTALPQQMKTGGQENCHP